MKFYEDLKLPELAAFRGETVETPHRSLPRPLDMKALSAMEAASAEARVEDPAVYVAHLLFSRLGLRNIEIVNARTHWISDGSIGIINRSEENFFPKGCEGWVPVARDVLAEIMKFRSLTTDNYLVPGKNQTERHQAVYRRHSKWVSKWIKGRAKTSYELRRYAGSRLLDMGATIFEVRDFLRHRECKPRSNGTPIGCRIVHCARSECATCCRRWISMSPKGDNVDEVKEQLRRDLLPCFDAATLTNAVFSVLSSVGNKGLKEGRSGEENWATPERFAWDRSSGTAFRTID